ncbi:MAG: 2-aminoethylphosphonate-pyruvate transaminase [Acidimicrobiales bacterium]|jgi:2-aminoethylphosphonate-pyruvate transaminase
MKTANLTDAGNPPLNKLLLFTPGPVNVSANVRDAIAREDICHREIEFEQLFRSVEAQLLRLFEIREPQHYQAVVITGSGSAANEAMLASVVGDQNILILSNGEFGERLHATSEIHNSNTFQLTFPWGTALDLNVIDNYLRDHRIDVIAVAHHETSSGMLNPLAAIGSLAKSHNAILLVDCVSSAGAEAIDMERDNIAFCSASSSKAIGSYAGLSFVIGKRDEFEKLAALPAKTAYLNLHKFFQFATQRSQTPNTPAVPLFYALNQALANILIETVPGRRAKILRTATRLRKGMTKLGLTYLLETDDMCSVLTTVHLPPHVDIDQLRHSLRKQSIIIYEGKGPLAGRVFQVGSIGELSKLDIKRFLRALADALTGIPRVAPPNVNQLRQISPGPITIAPTAVPV